MVDAVKEATRDRIAGAPATSSGTKRLCEDEDETAEANRAAKQARVLQEKRRAHTAAPPGTLPAYVGPKGERWRPDAKPAIKGALPPHDPRSGITSLFFGTGAPEGLDFRSRALSAIASVACSVAKKPRHADAIIVDSVSGRWESLEAFEARLWENILVDAEYISTRGAAGTLVRFLSARDRFKRTIFFSPDFEKENSRYARALVRVGLDGPLKVLKGAMPPDSKTFVGVLS